MQETEVTKGVIGTQNPITNSVMGDRVSKNGNNKDGGGSGLYKK